MLMIVPQGYEIGPAVLELPAGSINKRKARENTTKHAALFSFRDPQFHYIYIIFVMRILFSGFNETSIPPEFLRPFPLPLRHPAAGYPPRDNGRTHVPDLRPPMLGAAGGPLHPPISALQLQHAHKSLGKENKELSVSFTNFNLKRW